MARILALVLEGGGEGGGRREQRLMDRARRRGTLCKRRTDEKMTAAPAEKGGTLQTGTIERRQGGEETAGRRRECVRRASGAEVEPECFHFLPLAAGGRDFEARGAERRRFPDSGKPAARGGLFQRDKSGRRRGREADTAAPPLTGPLTYVRAGPWSGASSNTSGCGLWSVTAPPARPAPRLS